MAAELYDRIGQDFALSPGNRDFYRATTSKLVDDLRVAGGEGMDLACGTGFSTEVLLERLPRVRWSGLDPSQRMLEVARTRLPGTPFFQASAESMPFESGRFDVVVCNFGFHWLKPEAISEIARVLRPGGTLAMNVPTVGPPAGHLGNRLLRKELLARKGRVSRLRSQGLAELELHQEFGNWAELEIRIRTVLEQFQGAGELFSALESRGSLSAIFGDFPPTPGGGNATPIDFQWTYASLTARRPADCP